MTKDPTNSSPPHSSPPTLAVKGDSIDADQIVKLARRYGVPVVEKPELADALFKIDVGAEIPESLFIAAAALLVEIDGVAKRD